MTINLTEKPITKKDRPYLRVETDIRARIKDGRWVPGSMLPSRKDLAQEFGVALTVVERAVAGLLADGTLYAMDRRGTFVAIDDSSTERPAGNTVRSRSDSSSKIFRGGRRTSPERFFNIGVLSTMNYVADGSSLADYWRGIILNSLERTVTHAGGMSSFLNLYMDNGENLPLSDGVEQLVSQSVDALVVIKERGVMQSAEASKIAESNGVPIMFVIPDDAPPSALVVGHDSKEAGYQAGNHLLERNFENLLFFSPYSANWVLERLSGVQNALLYSGIDPSHLQIAIPDVDISQTSGIHEELAYRAAQRLLRSPLRAPGVVAANDHAAYGFIQAASEVGLKVGVDYGIVGFDDMPQSRKIGLTTLHPPLEQLGREAGLLLMRVLTGQSKTVQIRLMSDLIARNSSQPLS